MPLKIPEKRQLDGDSKGENGVRRFGELQGAPDIFVFCFESWKPNAPILSKVCLRLRHKLKVVPDVPKSEGRSGRRPQLAIREFPDGFQHCKPLFEIARAPLNQASVVERLQCGGVGKTDFAGRFLAPAASKYAEAGKSRPQILWQAVIAQTDCAVNGVSSFEDCAI